MSTTNPRISAKIYAFPPGGRSRGGRHDWAGPGPASRERTPDIMPASGGYHDEAIREERARKP